MKLSGLKGLSNHRLVIVKEKSKKLSL